MGDILTLGIRPEHFELEQTQGFPLSATVDIIERLGNETYIYANDANDNLLTVVGDGELTSRTGRSSRSTSRLTTVTCLVVMISPFNEDAFI